MAIDYQRLISRYHPRYIAGQPPHKSLCFVDFVILLVDCQELACLGTSQVFTD